MIEANHETHTGPWRITLDTNPDHCNYACIMCECFSPYSSVKLGRTEKRVMSPEILEKALREAKALGVKEVIPSTMGEPLLYKHFERLLQLCIELEFKLNLTTNGSWPIKGVEAWARQILPIASDIKVSWNGITSDTHEKVMKGAKFNKSVSDLKTLLQLRDEISVQEHNRATVTLQLTFMKVNLHEIPDLISWAITQGIDRIKGHHLWAHFNEIKGESLKASVQSVEQWNNMVDKAHRIAETHRLPSGAKIKLEHFTYLSPEDIFEVSSKATCPFLGKEIWINAEGEFNPCCAPNEERKTLGYFGNIASQSLSKIWHSAEYKHLKENYHSYDLCKRCNMRKEDTC